MNKRETRRQVCGMAATILVNFIERGAQFDGLFASAKDAPQAWIEWQLLVNRLFDRAGEGPHYWPVAPWPNDH